MKKYLYAAFLVVGLAALLMPPQAFAQDEKPFTVHGEVRFRGEYNNNATDLDNDLTDGGLFWPYRVRIGVEGKFTKNVVGYIEVQTNGVSGGDTNLFFGGGFYSNLESPRQIGNGTFQDTGLYQGYVTLNELWSKSFSLRFGRQEIVAGDEFLLGDEDFYGGISHDGIVANWDFKKVNIKAWYTRPFEGSAIFIDGDVPPAYQSLAGNGTDIDFFGGYATFPVHKDWGVDVYLMDVNDRGLGGSWQVVGARFDHENWDKKGLVWNAEYAIETGKLAGGASNPGFGTVTDVDASGQGGEFMLGWNFKGGKNVHRVYGRIEYATGDDSTSSDEYEGFVPLFGEIHGRTGQGDWFRVSGDSTNLNGFSGLNGGLDAWSVGYTGKYNDKHELGAAYWDYSLQEDNGSADGDKLGTAVDVWYGYNYSKNVAFQVSYSDFMPDDALTFSGAIPDDSVERLYGQVRLRF